MDNGCEVTAQCTCDGDIGRCRFGIGTRAAPTKCCMMWKDPRGYDCYCLSHTAQQRALAENNVRVEILRQEVEG